MKARLRSEKLLERLAHAAEEKKLKEEQIFSRVENFAAFKKARQVLFYLPIHGEVDLQELFNKYKKQKKFILPRVNKVTLDLMYVKDWSDTEIGSFKLTEPKKHLEKAFPKDIDLILVPGVVFGLDGHRIGYGKGFYDRLLKKTQCPKIGVAYEFQIVENIPGEEHDVKMDLIVTETRSIKPKAPKQS